MKNQKVKLFCVPYGGASALVYNEMIRYLHPNIELYPLEFPARGLRFKDPYYKDIDSAIKEMVTIIISEASNSNYAILGHCMGSILVYEACKQIQEGGYNVPVHIFFCGSRAPHSRKEGMRMQEMTDKQVVDELLEIGRIDQAFFNDKENFNRFLIAWKADCDMMDHYAAGAPVKLHSDVSVFGGTQDGLVSYYDLQEWEIYSDRDFIIREIEGDHFFINAHREKVVQIVNESLDRYFS